MAPLADEALGLYLSVPFCRAKCTFCNFSSGVGTAAGLDRYVTLLCREIRLARTQAMSLGHHLPERVDTLYFGGGTPSLLQPAQLGRVFAALRESFVLDATAEITMEAAPGQIAADLLDEAQRQGVNRISLGVQSFVDREAAAVGRLHTAHEALEELTRLERAGIPERALDLIAGLPQQTAATWQHSLKMAAEAAITHLSVYMLEVDEDSRLGREVLAGGTRLHAHAVGSDDLIADCYETACTWLPAHGFAQYEISNFAGTSAPTSAVQAATPRAVGVHQSRHNRKYWERSPYLGLGLDAHSMLTRASDGRAIRFANNDEMHDYEMGVPGTKPTVVSDRDAFEEAIFLGLRLVEGISFTALRASWPEAWIAECDDAAAEMLSEGLLRAQDDFVALTTRGRLLSNDVFGRLLNGVPA